MGINIINCLSTGCEHSLDLSWPENKIMPDHGRGRGLGIGFGFGNRYRRLDLLIDDRRMLGGPGSTPVARKDTRCHSLCKKRRKRKENAYNCPDKIGNWLYSRAAAATGAKGDRSWIGLDKYRSG